MTTFFSRLKRAWLALRGVAEPVPLYSRDPRVVGANPSRLARIAALRMMVIVRFERALLAGNAPSAQTLGLRSLRFRKAFDAALKPAEAIYAKASKQPGMDDCDCPASQIRRAVETAIKTGNYSVVGAATVSNAPGGAGEIKLKSEAELDALIQQLQRDAKRN